VVKEGLPLARRGWAEPHELTVPAGTRAIDELTATAPTLAGLKAELRALPEGARAALLRQCEGSGDAKAKAVLALAREAWAGP
jgi:hypothetical protein